MADLEALLTPVSDDEPSGPDMSYDHDRGIIEQAFDRSVSIDTSGDSADGGDTDWRDIIKMIETQSAQTKDIWLAVYMCRAGARSSRLDLVVTGAGFLAGLMEGFWDTVHPQLEEYGFQGRKGPCESLTKKGEFLGPLESVVLLENPRFGRFSAADFGRFSKGAESETGYAQFRAAMQDTSEEMLQEIIRQVDTISDGVRRTDAVLTAQADGDTGVNFRPTYDVLDQIRRAVAAFTSTPVVAADPQWSDSESTAPPQSSSGGPRIAGQVDSREDVLRALDAINDYYRRREPTSPVPAALRRAREWVNLDFLSLLEDIAPGALDEAKRILNSQREPTVSQDVQPPSSGSDSGW